MVWLFPGQTHVLLDRSPDLELVIGMFSPKLVRRFTVQSSHAVLRDANPAETFCRVIPARDAVHLRQLFADPVWLSEDIDGVNAGLGYAMTRSWSVFRAAATNVHGVELHPAVERALRVLAEEGMEDRFDSLARRCGLSPSRLALLFRRQIGVTPGEFRLRCRLRGVLEAIGDNPHCNLLEAALAGGFSTYLQFYRAFRKQFGMSPRHYKQRLAEDSAPRPDLGQAFFKPAKIQTTELRRR
jgi:AraC-like DNA-binding protein